MLRWQKHIEMLTSNVRKLSYVFREVRNILDPGTLKNTYYALCQSILCYGIIGWGGCASTILRPLEVAQKCILKIIERKPYRYPTDQLYKECNILIPRLLYIKIALIHAKFKMPLINVRVRLTRAAKNDDMIVPRTCTTFGQRHFNFIAPRMYNYLPDAVKRIETKNSFKKSVSRWLITEGREKVNGMLNIVY